MKALRAIEKRKETWFLILTSFIFFLLRLPSLIEPYWYGDEGVYEVIGMALDRGSMLYSQIWDNKPPLLYIIYAVAGADQFTVRLLSLIFGIVSVILFYYLSQKIIKEHKICVIITIFYVLLLGGPFIEGNIANAENFILLFTVGSGLIIYNLISSKYSRANEQKIFFLSGLILGIAFLLKIVALFDFAAFFIFVVISLLPDNFSFKHHYAFYKKISKKMLYYCIGFILPLALTSIYFFTRGAFSQFIQAAFFSNISYVGYENKFLIPQGLLIIKLIPVFLVVFFIFLKRKSLSQPAKFVFLWFAFSCLNVFFSGRPWTHYLLGLLPSGALMLGLVLSDKIKKIKLISLGSLIIIVCISLLVFKLGFQTLTHGVLYYQNFILFITNNRSIVKYQEFFDKHTPRNYAVAQFIAAKIKPNEPILIWGNDPQIYVLSHTLPIGKYTVEYHISQSKEALRETAAEIRKTKPKYIVILSEMSNFPFAINAYINKFSIKGADIYERTF